MKPLDKIISVARPLIFREGIRSVSMDDIAQKLSMSKKTIYTIVPNKKELVKRIVLGYIQIEQAAILNLIERTENAIQELIEQSGRLQITLQSVKPKFAFDLRKYYPEIWIILEENHFVFIQKIIRKNILRGMEEGLYRTNIDIDLLPKLYLGMAQQMAKLHGDINQTYDAYDLTHTLLDYHLNGIVNNKGKEKLKKLELNIAV